MCRFQQYKSIGEIVQNKSGTHNSNTDIGSHKINDNSAEETHGIEHKRVSNLHERFI